MSPRIGLDLPAILEAAVEIADKQGIQEVTLASLAQKLNIRPPSLYNHVNGLQGLRTRLAIHGLEQLHSAMTNAAVGRAGEDAIRAMGEAYVEFARVHPGLYEATLLIPPTQDPDVEKTGSKIVELTVRVLKSFGLEGDMALHATRGLRSLFHGFASLEQKGGFGIPLDLNVSSVCSSMPFWRECTR